MSAGIVVGGIVIFYTNWFWIDNALSIVIAGIIIFSTWRLLRESLKLSLDGVPEDIRVDDIQALVLKMDGVRNIHHVHIWAISSTENAMTAHLVLANNLTRDEEFKIKRDLKHALEQKNIQHITIEIELENEACKTVAC